MELHLSLSPALMLLVLRLLPLGLAAIASWWHCFCALPHTQRGASKWPARFGLGGERVAHPFDGDGAILSVSFPPPGGPDRQVTVRYKFVKTRGFVEEERAKKLLFPGQFGNPRPIWDGGGFLKQKNLANTNVVYTGAKRLFALWEGGLPHELDPISLDTLGEVQVGKLKSVTAHPRYDASSDRLVAFSYTPNPISGTEIQVFELEDGGTARACEQATTPPLSITLPKMFGLFHDFVVTKNYVVFTAAPTVFGDLARNGLSLLLGQKSPAECIEWDESQGKATMWVMERDRAGV